MPSQIPKEEINAAYQKIMELSEYLPASVTRYLEKEVIGYVSQGAIHSYMLNFLKTYASVLSEFNEIPEYANEEIQELSRESVKFLDAYEYEKKIGHDVRGLVRACQDKLSEKAKSFIYLGLTSYDVVNTAQSAALRDFGKELMIPAGIEFTRSLIKRLEDTELKDAVMMGRTHKQHATATTFGHWVGEILEGFMPPLLKYNQSIDNLRGKASGFVGTNAAKRLLFKIHPNEIDERLFQKLDLKKDIITGQVVHQYFYEDYFLQLFMTCYGLAKFAEDIRNYQQTEIAEMVDKKIKEDEVGSSTGSHKINPKTAEQISGGRIRQLTGQVIASFADMTTDFQRDLRDSMNKRYYMFEIPNISHGMMKKSNEIANEMTVRKDKMLQNIGLTQGLICAEPLQNYLQKWIGFNSDKFVDAHDYVMRLSKKSLRETIPFLELILNDELIQKALEDATPEQREQILNPEKYIGTCIEDMKEGIERWEKQLYELENSL